MYAFIPSWGLPLDETLLVVALILVVVDFFLTTDIPTHVAYVLVATVVARHIPAHVLYQVLGGLGAWFALVTFHYLVWRNILQAFSNRFVAPDRHHLAAERVVGAHGEIKIVEGKTMVSIEGDLWPVEDSPAIETGTMVRIVSQKDGAVRVERLPRRNSDDRFAGALTGQNLTRGGRYGSYLLHPTGTLLPD